MATALLVNPPLWNAYAPHLAVPLLAGVLRSAGIDVAAADLSAEALDLVLSREGLTALTERIEERARQARPGRERRDLDRALLLLPNAVEHVDRAKQVLRSVESLHDHDSYLQAQVVLRNALRCVSAAFPGLQFDLVSNNLYYSARSTEAVLEASADGDRNVYAWAFERLLPPLLADPDLALVGVSVSADTQLIAALTVARAVKRARPDVRVAFGGNFTTRMISRWREPHPFFRYVDAFVGYEGEAAVVPLVEEALGKAARDSVPGAVFVEDGALVRTPARDADLALSPVPEYGLFPLDKYFAPGPILPIFASRSCAWSCAFCSIPYASNRFRMRRAAAIVDEMETLAERHGTRYFMFADEIMTIRTLRELTSELVARDNGFFWYGETRFANGWTPELAEALHRSGCRRMNFGLESYNQRVLDLMRKEVDVGWIDANVDMLLRAGVPIHLFTIVGFPGEQPDETERTLEYARETVRRSREEYGVPWSTWGTSPFILDLLSPVGVDPASYGVELVPNDGADDLSLIATYRVAGGVSPDDAQVLADAVKGVPAAEEDPLWFHRDHRKDVEELTFLRACVGAGFPGHICRPAKPLAADWEDGVVELGADVLARRTRGAIVEADERPRFVLYRPVLDVVLELSAAWGRLDLRRPRAARELVERLVRLGEPEADAREACATMLRFGFLVDTAARPAAGNGVPVGFRREQRVVESVSAEELRLQSQITGKTLVLNEGAASIWDLCSRGEGVTLDELLARVAADDRDKAQELLEVMTGHGLCYAAAAPGS